MADISIHNVTEVKAEKIRELSFPCETQVLVIHSDSGKDEVTLFSKRGTTLPRFYDEDDMDRAKSNTAMNETLRNTIDFEHSARGQITGHVQALYDDLDDWAPGPDDSKRLMSDALEAWLDLANGTTVAEAVHRAQAHRANLRAVAHEWEQWEDANQAELAICHALTQAFYLWTYRATNPRFFNAFAAALHGLGWGQGLLASR